MAQITGTYRLQLRADFDFDAASRVAPYLSALGVSHLYASPYLKAAPGSAHGYDVVDHHSVNPELGGDEGHQRMQSVLAEHNLGQVLDIVPNHMAITGPENSWWQDVLENGPSSRYASYFDVSWDPPEMQARNKVLLPVLGDHYGRVLDDGQLRLTRSGSAYEIRYYDHVYPVSPRTLDTLLHEAALQCGSNELAFLADAFGRLPVGTTTDHANVEQRHRDKEVLRKLLARLTEDEPAVAQALDAAIAAINSDPDRLDELLERQNYRLAFWRVTRRAVGYRRFFDINDLVALRTDLEQVFRDSHQLLMKWVDAGTIDGLRVDHPDGLLDPEEYFERLTQNCPKAWIVAEKILEPGERLPAAWPIDGTTGYDFLNVVGGLMVDPAAEEAFTEFYGEFTGEQTDPEVVKREAKTLVMRRTLGGDLNRLSALLAEVCEGHRRHRDYTYHELREALLEFVVSLPVYRTYVRAGHGQIRDEDVRHINEAVEAAKRVRRDLPNDLYDFLREVLLLRQVGPQESELVMRLQQLTGPAMAKGVEDTAHYRYHRLVSLNEVGCDPARFGATLADFHRECTETQTHRPLTMLTTSTHDTKRSEDTRARLNVLSEIPELWRAAVSRWSTMAEPYRRDGMPDRNAEYLMYQTLVGAWPLSVERLTLYLDKAVREAKVHTSWTDPNASYEDALRSFAAGLLGDEKFVADLESFVAKIRDAGWQNSLSQTLIKLTAPGIPDVYQGCDLWDHSLVDPDNRRPVDFDRRGELLKVLDELSAAEIWQRRAEGLPKLHLIRQGLQLRQAHPEWFGRDGHYQPLAATGDKADHVVAFARADSVVTVAQRLSLRRGDGWSDTALPLEEGRWKNLLDGRELATSQITIEDCFSSFPVALLIRVQDR